MWQVKGENHLKKCYHSNAFHQLKTALTMIDYKKIKKSLEEGA
ncbi:MAG: hypothetical protein RML35_08455 [Chloroherpetonaceae bacterium]|nr:hypothetical protein [Chloroherpetonaceae bacterium]